MAIMYSIFYHQHVEPHGYSKIYHHPSIYKILQSSHLTSHLYQTNQNRNQTNIHQAIHQTKHTYLPYLQPPLKIQKIGRRKAQNDSTATLNRNNRRPNLLRASRRPRSAKRRPGHSLNATQLLRRKHHRERHRLRA